ncbi:hypothetical protein Pint_14832 [Pistacia integerrima]|uniref:Uncharacterized protein n=1 Tax=Pistacia integerrima TaxID=434235 RepID=A0ACC0ZFT4_9ROSI|nr:hypothetical protein Pint_14832 [Pistacia integerrima]
MGWRRPHREWNWPRESLLKLKNRELEAKQLRDYVNQLESRAFELAETQREIVEARAIIEEAERSLLLNADGIEDGNALVEKESEGVDSGVERLESITAASVSALVGSLAWASHLFYSGDYQRDLDNIQLKTGTSAAFGFVKGLGALSVGPPLELNIESFLSHASNAALYVSENLLIFLFAAVGLDFCFKMGLISPFPMKRSDSSTNTR